MSLSASSPADNHDDTEIFQSVEAVMPSVIEDIKKLIRIPSVSSIAKNPALQESAQFTAQLLREAGGQVRIVESGGAPAILAHFSPAHSAVTKPRVLLYAHHDVQPVADETLWKTPPFEPVEKNGRLYARGAADDKAGIAVHLAVMRAFRGKPPVPVTVFIEGEEEIGSPSLENFLEKYQDDLDAEVMIIADSVNWDQGIPALTVSLRGMADCIVEVATLEQGVHSGMFGGPIPDALTTLCQLLATLHDHHGNIAVQGIDAGVVPDNYPHYPQERLKVEAGLLPHAECIGTGSISEQLWYKPSISVLAIESPSIEQASNTLIARAKAKIGLRIPPGVSAHHALDALVKHLYEHCPWPAEIIVHKGEIGEPYSIDTSGEFYELASQAYTQAWGVNPVNIGMGGSIPLVAALAQKFPHTKIFVTGVEDPYSAAHGPNESVNIGECEKTAIAEAIFLDKIARWGNGKECLF